MIYNALNPTAKQPEISNMNNNSEKSFHAEDFLYFTKRKSNNIEMFERFSTIFNILVLENRIESSN